VASVTCADPALELRYLASVLHRAEALEQAPVSHADLTSPAHQALLGALIAIRAKREEVTPSALRLELDRQGRLSQVGEDRLLQLESTLELDPHACARRLRELSQARTLRDASLQAAALAERGSLLEARSALAAVAFSEDASEDPVLTFRELLTESVSALSEASKTKRFVRLGTPNLDDVFRAGPGDLVVLGAATNVGKSTLLWTWAMSLARSGTAVGIISIEDGAEDFGSKGLAAISGVDASAMWSTGLRAEHSVPISSGIDREANLPISFAKIRSRSIEGVVSRMAYMVRVRGCKVLLVDYLQAIRHRDVGTSTREKVNDSLATLMAAAAQLGATLVLASQLRRASEGGKYQEPGDGDLKESGDIENSAQAIVLLWRETDEESDPRYGVVYGKVAKVKRASAGRRFWMRRDSYGLLIEQGGPAPKKTKGGW